MFTKTNTSANTPTTPTKTLTLIRGVPGAGKTTFAKKLIYQEQQILAKERATTSTSSLIKHYEADMWFTSRAGVYRFDHTQLDAAHLWCEGKALNAMQAGIEQVFVSNTFVKLRHLLPYMMGAVTYGYVVELIRLPAPLPKALSRNTHGVPEKAVTRMAAEMEPWDDELARTVRLWEPFKDVMEVEVFPADYVTVSVAERVSDTPLTQGDTHATSNT